MTLIDALIDVDPEPCSTCDSGIQFIHCWDGRGRCLNCIHSLAAKLGWDQYNVDWDWDKKPETVKPTLALPVRQDPKLDL